jgi:site-specific recombinase XerD
MRGLACRPRCGFVRDWSGRRDSNPRRPAWKAGTGIELLNRLTVSQLAELSNFSKAYISQVKSGKRPPSRNLIAALSEYAYRQRPQPSQDYLRLFFDSRMAMGVSPKTIAFYEDRLGQFTSSVEYTRASRQKIERYLNTIPANSRGLATRHASFRAIRTFYRWLESEYGIANPVEGMKAPILGKPIMPTLSQEQVQGLLEKAETSRDRAIVALFAESGLRLSELASIRAADIDWQARTIRTIGKGRKEALAPFGTLSAGYLKEWLSEYQPNGSCIWGINRRGIQIMMERLGKRTGLPCNPHTFRRTFAVLLRKAGVDTMTIRDLGRWESVQMVERYTRSFGFSDAMKFYKAPLG